MHHGRWRTAAGWAMAFALAAGPAAAAAEPTPPRAAPIVIGQSVGLGPRSSGSGPRMAAGTKAYVERINAAGGINGRPLQLVTLEDNGDPQQLARNLRLLVTTHGATALVNCAEASRCNAAAEVARELRVPLVGAQAGTPSLAHSRNPMVFRVRAGVEREAEAIARQLVAIGCQRIAIVSDPTEPEVTAVLLDTLARRQLAVQVLTLPSDTAADRERLLASLAQGRYHAAVVSASAASIEALSQAGLTQRPEWPRVLVSPANSTLATLMGSFDQRFIGFSSVVPNAEDEGLPITRELHADADRFSSGKASTPEGMEAYIAMRVLVEALRRSGPHVDASSLRAALDRLDGYDVGGFTVSFARGRESGSDWVDMGVRSRAGVLLK